jgi:hypothetical protein
MSSCLVCNVYCGVHAYVGINAPVCVANYIIKTDADDACMCDNIFYFFR